MTAGPLALVGGDEFHPGNEAQDALLCEAAGGRPAYIVATAARDNPEAAVATAQRWFRRFDVDVTELRVRTITDARSTATAEQAKGAGLIYICGGDPGRVAQAWRAGCALAGSSAGAMALCEWSLVRRGFPGHTDRRGLEALNLVPGSAFLPHYDTFGERWIPSAQESVGVDTLLIGVDERSAAVWGDGAWSAMGPGRVVLVKGDERRVFPAPTPVDGMPQPDIG